MSETHPLRLIAVLAFIGAIGPFTVDAYLPALPQLAVDLGATPAAAQWTLAVYLVGIAIFPLILSPISDAFGRLPTLRCALAAYVAASAACAAAPSIEALLALRLAQAACGGVAMTVTRAVLADRWSGNELSRATSQLMLIFTIAPVVAPLAGAGLMQFGGWRAIFWALAIYGVLAFLALSLIDESLPRERRAPYRPAMILSTYWTAARGAGGARPHLATVFWSAVIFFAMLSAAPFIFIEHFGATPTMFGWLFAGISAIAFVANAANARIVMRRGYARMTRDAARASAALAAAFLAIAATGFGGIWGVFAVMLGLMACFHVFVANTAAGVMSALGARAGAASALMALYRFTGGALGVAVVSAVGDPHPLTFALALGVGAAGTFLVTRRMA